MKYALTDEVFRLWPRLQFVVQAIGPHVLFEVLLVALQRWSRGAVGEDVALRDELGQRHVLRRKLGDKLTVTPRRGSNEI